MYSRSVEETAKLGSVAAVLLYDSRSMELPSAYTGMAGDVRKDIATGGSFEQCLKAVRTSTVTYDI